ncbi:MAG: WD40 repeat domain-containing protein [Chloroflexi bacterium]|nr:WD40 repeat domain-containing protein [Chloroflexota bacterium]
MKRLAIAGVVLALSACGGAEAPAASTGASQSGGASASGGFHLTQVIEQPAGSNKVETTAFAPDGQRLAVGLSDGTIAIFSLADTSAPPVLSKLHAGASTALAWSPDGTKLLSAATNGSVYLEDAASLQVLHSFNAFPNSYPAVAWSPDGSQLAIAQGKEAVQVFQASAQAQVATFALPSAATRALLWLPSGEVVASDDSGAVEFFVQEQAAAVRTFMPPTNHKAVNSISASPDGKTIAAAYDDGALLLLDAATAKQTKALPMGREAGTVSWSPNGQVLAVTSVAFDLRLFDVSSGAVVDKEDLGYDTNGSAWSPDGRYLALGVDDNTFRIYQVQPPQTPPTVKPATAPSYMGR